MKKRFLLVLAAMLCLVMIAFAIPAMADSEPTTSIMGHNLALEDAVDIIYYVDFQNIPDGAESGVLVWRNPQDSYTYGTEDAKLSTVGKDYGYDKFIFPGVAAKMMTQNFYAVSYIKNGDEITYSELDKYSVLQYAYNKKGDTTKIGGSKTLGELLTGMLDYGTLAQQYFNYNTSRLANATYYQISVVGATLPDGTTKGLYQAGEKITLTASAQKSGTTFDCWQNGAGNEIGDLTSLQITVGTTNAAYTATYLQSSHGLEFESNEDGTCALVGMGDCTDVNVVVPRRSAPDGDLVTSIDGGAFRGEEIVSINLPAGIEEIGRNAFKDCDELLEVYWRGTVAEWENIDLKAGNTPIIEAGLNYTKTGLRTHTAPDSPHREVIDAAVVPTCTATGLTEGNHCSICGEVLASQNAVAALGHDWDEGTITTAPTCTETGVRTYACLRCGATYTGTVAALGHDWDDGTITTAPTCTETGVRTYACLRCEATYTGTASALGHHYEDGICTACGERKPSEGLAFTSNGNGTCSVSGIGTCTDTDVVIPRKSPAGDRVMSIESWAFNNRKALTSITIPDGVTSIGSYAFQSCSALTSVTIPDSVTNIGDEAFRGCSALTSITIPDSVTSIGNSAFYGCSVLTSITIPDSVTSIGSQAFRKCSSLTSVTIGNGVTSIGSSAFSGCSSLASVTIGNGVTGIGPNAFYNCSALTSITIPNSVTSIGDYAFDQCSKLTSVTIGNGITSMGQSAFNGCSGLTSVTIGNGVTVIGPNAFCKCSALTSITIPDSVTSIGSQAFRNCSSLTSVTIGNGVTSIGSSAFSGCSALTSVTIPNSVTSIGTYAFDGCSKLQYTVYDNAKYLGNVNNPYVALMKADNFITSCIHPDMKVIYQKACYNCSALTSITIPDSVTSIGEYAFQYCYNLTSAAIGNGVMSIESGAFYSCKALTSITIPNSVTSIGSYAFSNCSSLTSITYTGTKAQWYAITKGTDWDTDTGNYQIYCYDGVLTK